MIFSNIAPKMCGNVWLFRLQESKNILTFLPVDYVDVEVSLKVLLVQETGNGFSNSEF